MTVIEKEKKILTSSLRFCTRQLSLRGWDGFVGTFEVLGLGGATGFGGGATGFGGGAEVDGPATRT